MGTVFPVIIDAGVRELLALEDHVVVTVTAEFVYAWEPVPELPLSVVGVYGEGAWCKHLRVRVGPWI